MAFEIRWEVQQHTLRLTFHGRWSWDDVRQSRRQIFTMLDELSHPVRIIVDWQSEIWIPGNIDLNMEQLKGGAHHRMKRVILVFKNPLFRNLARVYARKNNGHGCRYDVVDSVDNARRLLSTGDDD